MSKYHDRFLPYRPLLALRFVCAYSGSVWPISIFTNSWIQYYNQNISHFYAYIQRSMYMTLRRVKWLYAWINPIAFSIPRWLLWPKLGQTFLCVFKPERWKVWLMEQDAKKNFNTSLWPTVSFSFSLSLSLSCRTWHSTLLHSFTHIH